MILSVILLLQVIKRQSRSPVLELTAQLGFLLGLFTNLFAQKWLFPFLLLLLLLFHLLILLFLLLVLPNDLFLLIFEIRTDAAGNSDRSQKRSSSSSKEASPRPSFLKTGPTKPFTPEPKAPIAESKTSGLNNAGQVLSHGSVTFEPDITSGGGQSEVQTVLSGPPQASRPISEHEVTLIAQLSPRANTYSKVSESPMVMNKDADRSRNAPWASSSPMAVSRKC
jgi:hypothetical protein